MKAVNLNIKGITCDNSNCDFRDDAVEFKEYRGWLNKPCPKCGAILLTQKDLDATRRLIKIANIVNWFMKPFMRPDNNSERMTVIIEMNGTGEVKLKSQS